MFNDSRAKVFGDFTGVVGAVAVNNKNFVHQVIDRFDASSDVCRLVVGNDNRRYSCRNIHGGEDRN